jgi:hypothetical protein
MKLHRRAVLRGLLGGAAVSVALPAFESLLGRGAHASGGISPKRFVLFFWGNGIQPPRWIPADEGPNWTLSEQLAPLAPVKESLTVLSGFEVKTGNSDAHFSGPAGLFTGESIVPKPGGDWTFPTATLDQRIAAAIGGETLFRSLEVGVQPGLRGMSHNGPDSINTPESDPIRLYERLFGPTFRLPGENTPPDPSLALRRSVLDSVLADVRALDRRLGAVDRARLDQHLTAVRDLELRIARLQSAPVNRASCMRPEAPPLLDPIDGRPQMKERARVMADLSAMSLACDQTRVLSFWYSDPVSDVLYPNSTASHHQLTHDEPGDQPQVNTIVTSIIEDLAYMIGRLRDVPEGEGSLLDSVAMLATTDVSEGRTHQIDEYPIILAGKACGALRTGFHFRSRTKENTSHVALSLMRAMDVPTATYGVDAGEVDDGLSEIEA